MYARAAGGIDVRSRASCRPAQAVPSPGRERRRDRSSSGKGAVAEAERCPDERPNDDRQIQRATPTRTTSCRARLVYRPCAPRNRRRVAGRRSRARLPSGSRRGSRIGPESFERETAGQEHRATEDGDRRHSMQRRPHRANCRREEQRRCHVRRHERPMREECRAEHEQEKPSQAPAGDTSRLAHPYTSAPSATPRSAITARPRLSTVSASFPLNTGN